MRRIALCAATALLIPCAAASAGAPTTVTVDSHITPVIRQFTTKTTPATLTVNLDFHAPDGEFTSALKQAVLKFSYGAQLHGNLFPSCSEAQIRAKKKCPKGSQIGAGTGLGSLADAEEPITLKLFNGPKGKSITFLIQGERPAPIYEPITAPLVTYSGGLYNYGLTVPVPEILQQPLAGIDISLHFLKVKVNASRMVKGHRRGYIETLICPPGALVPMSASFDFREADPFSTDTFIHCG